MRNSSKQLLGTLTEPLPAYEECFLGGFHPPWECVHRVSQPCLILGVSACWLEALCRLALFYFILGSFFTLPSCLEKLLEWCLMDRKLPSYHQYCTSVCLYIKDGMSLSCIIYRWFCFCTLYQFVLWYCHSKESKLYRVRYEKRKKMAVIFHFAFLYMYFVPKDLFTYVNNSVSSAICFCFLDVFWKSVCWYRYRCTCWSPKAKWCGIACVNLSSMLLQPHQASDSELDANQGYFSYLPEEGAVVPHGCIASQQ